MKSLISLLFSLIIFSHAMGASFIDENKRLSQDSSLSFYQLKTEIINNIKNDAVPPISFESENAFLIVGIASMTAFVISVLAFNKEIFGTLPLTLFAVGVAGIILGT